jgi:hypothetical protein
VLWAFRTSYLARGRPDLLDARLRHDPARVYQQPQSELVAAGIVSSGYALSLINNVRIGRNWVVNVSACGVSATAERGCGLPNAGGFRSLNSNGACMLGTSARRARACVAAEPWTG